MAHVTEVVLNQRTQIIKPLNQSEHHWELLSLPDAETSFTRDAFPYCLLNDLSLHLEKSLPGVWGNCASTLAGLSAPE